jgi:hypothetical protein
MRWARQRRPGETFKQATPTVPRVIVPSLAASRSQAEVMEASKASLAESVMSVAEIRQAGYSGSAARECIAPPETWEGPYRARRPDGPIRPHEKVVGLKANKDLTTNRLRRALEAQYRATAGQRQPGLYDKVERYGVAHCDRV